MLQILLFLWFLTHLAGFAAIVHLLLSRKRTTSLVLWTLWLLFLPVLGIPLYFTFGSDTIRRRSIPSHPAGEYLANQKKSVGPAETVPLLETVSNLSGNTLTRGANIELLPDTTSYYPHLIQSIENAKDYIHFQTYVFRMDSAGDRILKALCEAAERGVEVRLLVDEIGSASTRTRYFNPLVAAGGKFSWCMTIQPLRNRYFFNLRNHRKIQIVDGEIAYVGGMNFGTEYEGKSKDVGPWRDMQMAIRGSVVDALQSVFATDWTFATEEWLSDSRYTGRSTEESKIPVTVVNSGPDEPDRSFLKTFILACNHAKERLDIFTPYFGPEDSVILAMQLAARRGVRVRMLIPTPNEHQYMVDIGRAHYEQLMEDGVEIYEYHQAVHHGKVYLIDDNLFVLGSTNLDARSLRINFETTLLIEDRKTLKELDEHYKIFFEQAERIDLEQFRNQPLTDKLKQGISRLFVPIL